jgi:hypothetical protein
MWSGPYHRTFHRRVIDTIQNYFPISLLNPQELSVPDKYAEHLVDLLGTGVAPRRRDVLRQKAAPAVERARDRIRKFVP